MFDSEESMECLKKRILDGDSSRTEEMEVSLEKSDMR